MKFPTQMFLTRLLLVLMISFLVISHIAGAAYLDQEWKTKRMDDDDGYPYGIFAYDIDDDNSTDLLVGTDHSTVEIYDGASHDYKYDLSLSHADADVDCIRVAEVDDDDDMEIIVAFNDGMNSGFAVFDIVSRYEEFIIDTLPFTSTLAIGNVDGNPGNEIVVGADEYLRIYGHNGTDFVELWVSADLGFGINAVAIGDIDSTTDIEIIVGYMNDDDTGGVSVYDENFDEKWKKTDFPYAVWSLTVYKNKLYIGTAGYDSYYDEAGSIYIYQSSTEADSNNMKAWVNAIVLADFSGDGTDEVIIGTHAGVWVYDLTFSLIGKSPNIYNAGSYGNLFVIDIDKTGDMEVITHSNPITTTGSFGYVFTQGTPDNTGNDNTNNNGTGSNGTSDLDLPLIGALGTICIALCCGFFIIDILIMVWVYKDAEKRGESGAKWLIIVLITGIIGLIVWFVVRPKTFRPGYAGGGGYSGSGYSPGGPPSGGVKGKGKIIIGVVFLVLGILMYMILLPYVGENVGISPEECQAEFEENPDGEWTVYGTLADKEGFSLIIVSSYTYSFEEEDNLTFHSNDNIGNNGDKVVIVLEGEQEIDGNWTLEFKDEHIVSKWIQPAGGLLLFLGVILLIVGAVQFNKTKGLKPLDGGSSGTGNVDISTLMGGQGADGGVGNQPPMGGAPGMMPGQGPIQPGMDGMPPGMQPGMPPGMMPGGQQPQGMGMPQQGPPGMQQMGQQPQMPQMGAGGMQELPGMDHGHPPQQMPPGSMGGGPSLPPGMQQPGTQPGQGMPPQGPPGMLPGGQQPPGMGMPPGMQQPGTQPGQGIPPQGPPGMQPGGQPPLGMGMPPGMQQPGPQPGQGMPPQGPPTQPQYQAPNWNCPNCQTSVESKFAFCTSCGFKRHG